MACCISFNQQVWDLPLLPILLQIINFPILESGPLTMCPKYLAWCFFWLYYRQPFLDVLLILNRHISSSAHTWYAIHSSLYYHFKSVRLLSFTFSKSPNFWPIRENCVIAKRILVAFDVLFTQILPNPLLVSLALSEHCLCLLPIWYEGVETDKIWCNWLTANQVDCYLHDQQS